MGAEVRTLDLVCLGLGQAGHALARMPVVLHQDRVARCVHHLVGVDPEALHVAEARRDPPRAEQDRQDVHRLGRLAHEVEDAVGVLAEGHRVWLQGVDDVGELDGVADEEDGEVVADQIPVAVLGVELHREAARVTSDLLRVAAADHGREADREVGLLAGLLEQLRAGVRRRRLVTDLAGRLEVAVGHEAACVHHRSGMRSRSKLLIFSRNW